MPVYEYACKACDHEFEREQRISDKPVKKCPSCGAMKAKRLISRTSFVLKGGGWYDDLYASPKKAGDDGKTADDKSSDAKSSEDKSSDAKTEGGGESSDSGKSKSDTGSDKNGSDKKKGDATKTKGTSPSKGPKGSKAA